VRDDSGEAAAMPDGGGSVVKKECEPMEAIDLDEGGSASRKAKGEPCVSDSSRNLVAQVLCALSARSR